MLNVDKSILTSARSVQLQHFLAEMVCCKSSAQHKNESKHKFCPLKIETWICLVFKSTSVWGELSHKSLLFNASYLRGLNRRTGFWSYVNHVFVLFKPRVILHNVYSVLRKSWDVVAPIFVIYIFKDIIQMFISNLGKVIKTELKESQMIPILFYNKNDTITILKERNDAFCRARKWYLFQTKFVIDIHVMFHVETLLFTKYSRLKSKSWLLITTGADPGGAPGARAPPLTLGSEAPKLSMSGPYLIFPQFFFASLRWADYFFNMLLIHGSNWKIFPPSLRPGMWFLT